MSARQRRETWSEPGVPDMRSSSLISSDERDLILPLEPDSTTGSDQGRGSSAHPRSLLHVSNCAATCAL
jgi:hypothetical protein